jgi:methylase of polypeptide subunit release factors
MVTTGPHTPSHVNVLRGGKSFFSKTGGEKAYTEWWLKQEEFRRDETITVGKLNLFVARDVFSPNPASTHSVDFLLRHLPSMDGKRVLDIGTGCGVFAIQAGMAGARDVVGTEVSESALENAKRNVTKFELSEVVSIVKEEHFEKLSGSFDVIIMNTIFSEKPQFSETDELAKRSLYLHQRLLKVMDRITAPGGVVVLGFGSFGDIETLHDILDRDDLEITVEAEERFGVNWYAIQVRKRSS